MIYLLLLFRNRNKLFNLSKKIGVMENLDLAVYGVEEMKTIEMEKVEGGFLPIVVIGGIWAFQLACCAVALGMREAANEHQIN